MSFKALLLTRGASGTEAAVVDLDESALPPGDVTVRVEYSTLNYKDALAITGRGAIVKDWPLVAGIDLAGVVEHSTHPDWRAGDRVVVNGWGLGETRHGGLAQRARVSAEWLLALPAPYGAHDAMAIGTAGYTAALCVLALQRHGLTPASGPVLVTGASGGVGAVDARHHRPGAHDRALVRDRQRVLVVERRVLDVHRDIALGQAGFSDVANRGAKASVVLLEQQSLEHRASPGFVRFARAAQRR